jgi:hypothetical protein
VPIRRLHRRLVAGLLAFCVVLAQTLAVAYACQREVPGKVEQATPCASHLAAADAPLPIESGNVCEVHCEPASLPPVAAPDLPDAVATIAWRLPALVHVAYATSSHDELEARIASPPARTLFARLLI